MDLPNGWVSCSLIDVNEVIAGQSPESQYYNQDAIGLPFFQGKTDFGSVFPTNRVYCTKPKKTALPGDVLLSVRAPVGPTNLAREEVGIGRGINAIRPLGGISLWFILYFLRSIEPILSGSGTGTTFKAVTVDQVRSLELPLPPLAEQRRIVEKIDALFSELDKGVEYLQTIKQQLKIYRQAVLKWAFEDIASWKPLGNFIEKIDAGKSYKCLEKPPQDAEFGIVKVSAVTWGVYNEEESKTCLDNSKVDEKYLINEGDFLFSRANTIQLVGACTIVHKTTRKLMLSDKILRIKYSDELDSKFAIYYLRSPKGRSEIEFYATGNQDSMRNIGQDRIKKISCPSIPVSEQKEIVHAIESRLSVCDSLERLVDENVTKADALSQSILKTAFEGRLVPQDPNDEPAEKLLERIQAERAAQVQPVKRRKKND